MIGIVANDSLRRGFNILELVLVLGSIGIIVGIATPVIRDYQIRGDLSNVAGGAEQQLRRAQLLAQSGKDDAPWGYDATTGTLYQGTSYATRKPAFDEVSAPPSSIVVSGLTDVSYEKITGEPSALGIMTFTALNHEQRFVEIEVNTRSTAILQNETIPICHNPNHNPQTMQIPDSAWPAHQGHGDTQGPCPGQSSPMSSSMSSSISSISSSVASSSSSGGGGGGGGGSSAGGAEIARIVLLQTTSAGALALSGNGSLTVGSNGAVYVNSNSSTAVTVSGNATLTSTSYYIVGTPGTLVSGGGHINGAVHGGSSAAADPYAALATPAKGTVVVLSAYSGNTTATLNPGTYNSISISGNASLTLAAGVYYLVGGLTVSGKGKLTGNNVIIYSETGNFSLSGNGNITLSPPSSGTYQNVLWFQNRSVTAGVSISGNGNLSIQGALYAAGSTVSITGNGNGNIIGSSIVAKKLSLSGNGTFTIQ